MDKLEQLEKAYKKEKTRVALRMLAVIMVMRDGNDITTTARRLHCCTNWVRKWVRRFEDRGLDGLYDLPRSGRPRAVPTHIMDSIMSKAMQTIFTPSMLQQTIIDSTGEKFHITYVRKLMRQYGMSRKTVQKYHINHASAAAVRSWQRRVRDRISRLKKLGFVIAMADEAFFVRDVLSGKKYWSRIGQRIYRPYTGRHESLAVFGTLTEGAGQMFRVYDRFNATTFVAYLEELHRKYGKIAIMLDRASVHKSKKVREYLKSNPDVRLIWLPKGSPYLNPVEQCWKDGKYAVLVSEYHASFALMNAAVSEFFRTTRFKMEITDYIYRHPPKILTNP